MTTNLFDEIKAAGIPFTNHESDLYVPKTPEVDAILDKYLFSKRNSTTFVNQVEGGIWYDVPFAYTPWWQSKASR
jgi:hypothetical protein